MDNRNDKLKEINGVIEDYNKMKEELSEEFDMYYKDELNERFVKAVLKIMAK